MRPNSFSHSDYFTALGLFICLLFLGYYQTVWGVCGVYHDDAIYVSTAKSLAEGKGYRLINLPDSPIQTKYPILYPGLLALIWKIWPKFPDNLKVMQLLTLIIGASTISLAYLYLIRFDYFPKGVVVSASLLSITSPFFLYFCGLTLSEMPFALLLISSLWFLERQIANSDNRLFSQILLGIVLSLPFLCRTAGMIVIFIGLILLYKNRHPCWLTAISAFFTIFLWILWMTIGTKWNDNGVTNYYTNYLTWWHSFGAPHFACLMLINTIFLLIGIISIGLGIFNVNFYFPANAWPIITFAGGLVIISLIRDLFNGKVLPYLLFGYVSLILIWPWPPVRFLVPVLPFLLAYLLNILWNVVKKIPFITYPKILSTFLIIVIVVVNLSIVRETANISQTMHYPFLMPLEKPISWSSYQDLFCWIKENTDHDEIIASGLDTMIYLYTGRRGFRPFLGNPISLFYWDNGPPPGNCSGHDGIDQNLQGQIFGSCSYARI